VAAIEKNVVLKKAGGSLVMTVPASARRALDLSEGTEMTVSVEGRRLVLETAKAPRPKYTLAQLLAEEKAAGIEPLDNIDRDWLDPKPVGREIW
jgi:antitoxin ChpS